MTHWIAAFVAAIDAAIDELFDDKTDVDPPVVMPTLHQESPHAPCDSSTQ